MHASLLPAHREPSKGLRHSRPAIHAEAATRSALFSAPSRHQHHRRPRSPVPPASPVSGSRAHHSRLGSLQDPSRPCRARVHRFLTEAPCFLPAALRPGAQSRGTRLGLSQDERSLQFRGSRSRGARADKPVPKPPPAEEPRSASFFGSKQSALFMPKIGHYLCRHQ